MTIQFDLKKPEGLKKGDILIFDGKKFDVTTKLDLTKDLKKQIKELKDDLDLLRQQTQNIRNQVNERQFRFLKAFKKDVK